MTRYRWWRRAEFAGGVGAAASAVVIARLFPADGVRTVLLCGFAGGLMVLALFATWRKLRLVGRALSGGGLVCPRCEYVVVGIGAEQGRMGELGGSASRCPECGATADRAVLGRYWQRVRQKLPVDETLLIRLIWLRPR